MKQTLFIFLGMLAFLGGLQAQSEDQAAIRARMEERLPAIDSLKSRKIVGENNRGFLEVRGAADAEAHQLVEAENADRRKVYALIAERTGSTPEQVGHIRAQKIAERSASGVLLQDAEGQWYEKK